MAELDVNVNVATKGADRIGSLGKGFASAAINVAKIALPIAGAIGGVTALAAEAEKSDARLANTFKHMKAGAFTTIPALNKQAEALGQLSSFDDEDIKDAQATLLTFGKVTGKAFDQGVQSAADMADFLGTDLQSATIQIGKALNDPVKGITALSRAGVSFTQKQQDTIKALVEGGEAAKAQDIILGELSNQFGGAAEALSGTAAGQTAQAFEDLTNAGEDIGAVFLPILASLAQGVSQFAHFVQDNMPTIKGIVTSVMDAIGQAFSFVATNVIPLIGQAFTFLAENVFPLFTQASGAIPGVFDAIGKAVQWVATNVFPTLLSIARQVIDFWVKNWPTVSSVFAQAFGAVANVVKVVWPIVAAIAKVLFPLVAAAAVVLFTALDKTFKLIGGIFEVTGNVVDTMVKAIGKSWLLLQTITTAVWGAVTGIIKGAINAVIDVINGFFGFLNGISFGAGPWDVGPIHVDAVSIDPFNIGLIPHLAEGGIISSPTLALLGERGPEAVIPLNRAAPPAEFHSHIEVRGEEPFIRDEAGLVRVQQRVAFLEGF